MVDISLENLLDKAEGSIYKLVIMAARRALELAEGQPKLIVEDASAKPATVALEEIAENKLKCKKAKAE